MPVTSTHPDFDATTAQWQRCRDTIGGSDTVKAAGTLYLPALLGQTNGEYQNYLMRANWFNAMARTVQGLLGALFRKDPMVTVPTTLQPHQEDITLTGLSFEAFAMTVVQELLSTGRYGVLVDVDHEDRAIPHPRWSGYTAESITNWRMIVKDGRQVLSLVVLKESIEVSDATDPFTREMQTQYRVLFLDADGLYQVDLYQQGDVQQDRWDVIDTFQPMIRSQRLNYIPFLFFDPTALTPAVEKPPLLDLVDMNLSHYRTSADLEHGRHFCGLPTPWLFGVPVGTEMKIGSAVAWVASDTNAKCGMLEFTGTGLGELRMAMEEKEAKMAAIGARLLENPRAGVEAAETILLRTQGETNFLQTLAKTASRGLTTLWQWHAQWMGVPDSAITVKVNDDFVEMRLSPEEIEALMKLWQGGAISRESLMWSLSQGEMIDPSVTIEEEMARIDAAAPLTLPLGSPTDEEEAAA